MQGVSPPIGADDLDLVRGVLCAYCWRDEATLVPTSAVAIHHELRRRNRDFGAVDALNILSMSRDVQRLEHGYWLPTPTHLVGGRGVVIVASGFPTSDLRTRHGNLIRRGNISRYVDDLEAMVNRPQPIIRSADWLQFPTSTVKWLRNYVREAKFGSEFRSEGIEVFRHWKAPSRSRWSLLANALERNEKYVLARYAGPQAGSRYVVLNLLRGTVRGVHELPPDQETLVRIMCGLRASSDDPQSLTITVMPDSMIKVCAGLLPPPERQLLDCLGSVRERSSRGAIEALLPASARTEVRELFDALGYLTEGNGR